MGFFARWRTHKKVTAHGRVEVSERDGVRRMHLGGDTVQSAMRVNAPDTLEIAYTRSMMAFLLFHAMPADITIVGLGGGSTAKWLYRYFPQAKIDVVEINPEVPPIAHAYFYLPVDEARLRIHIGDGAAYIATHAQQCDLLMVDGYDEIAQAPQLTTSVFYADCHAALKPRGVLVINLWGSDKRYHEYIKLISESFEGVFLCLPAAERGNVIVLAFERSPNMPSWKDLHRRGRELHDLYGLEFPRFVDDLKKLNLHNEKRLII